MGAHGSLPAPLPPNVSRLRGEATHSHPAPSLKSAPLAPRMPEAWLEPSRWNPLRRKVWRATVKELEPLGILAKADKEVLISFVEAVVLRERATAELEEDDLLVRTENGYIRNPNLLTLKQATDSIEKLARQLGCTPAIRLRMPRPEPDDEDLAL